MALIKKKILKEMSEAEMKEKLSELRLELLKANAQKSKKTNIKTKEIKKTIARILTRLNKKTDKIKENKKIKNKKI